jgi:hypothetical protein
VAVTYTQELLDKAKAYVEQPLTSRRYAEGLTEISSLYSAITGEAVGTCKQCQYSDYLAVVTNYVRSATRFLHPETMPESKYTIAPGLENEVFVHEGYNSAVTAENLTDQAVEYFISKGFKHAFILKPTAEGADASEAGKKPTEKQAAQARFTELFGTQPDDKLTIAQLSEHNKAKEADAAYTVPVA